MLLKDKLFVLSVVAAVAAGFLASHALDCVMENLNGSCPFVLTAVMTGAAGLSGWFLELLQ